MDDSALSDRLAVLIRRYVGECGPALFAAYGLEAEVTPTEESGQGDRYPLAGIIGFVGDLSGTLLVGASSSVILCTHPAVARGRTISERMQLDWIGELANQLMGRLKLRLAAHGLSCDFSPPVSLAGDRMHHVGAAGRTSRHRIGTKAGLVNVWVDADVSESFAASELFFSDARSEDLEGSVTLF